MASDAYRVVKVKHNPSVNLSYLYHLNEKIALGAIATYGTQSYEFENSFAKKNLIPDGGFDSRKSVAEVKQSFLNIMATAQYRWFKDSRVQFYSKAGLGFCHLPKFSGTFSNDTDPTDVVEEEMSQDISDSRIKLAWQIIPIGADFPVGHNLTIFAEGGLGTSYCVQAGLKARF